MESLLLGVHHPGGEIQYNDVPVSIDKLHTGNFEYAELAKAALVASRLNTQIEVLEKRALIDESTGLRSKLALELELEATIEKSRTENTCLGGLFGDLDNFGMINKKVGHDKGDDVIGLAGRTLVGCLNILEGRAAGYRAGGDEFFVLVCLVSEDPAVELEHLSTLIQQELDTALKEKSELPWDWKLGASIGSDILRDGESAKVFKKRLDSAAEANKQWRKSDRRRNSTQQ